MKEGQKTAGGKKSSTFGQANGTGYQQIASRSKAKQVNIEQQNIPHNLDIFGSLTEEKMIVKNRLKAKLEEEAAKNPSKSNSKAGKL